MNKQELIDALAAKLAMGKQDAERALHGFVDVITETLKSGQEVNISGFGSFVVMNRSARMGVNPQKPEEKIQIAATKVPKFRAGKNLKEAVR
ncbi:MAG: DNA-binding protein [Candidatus Doudnabacteria bacterium RIFCSPLOWO2_02_FULL_49_13]|uniref:DNA-binding protein n=1 Tax=Candidatus Doudnabacteria bacterium RIFCSPHIGHO2_12_FULL_48_16 TaxID=1817838 RepID=A0A1F5PJR5_9BACT|nr:MAG: DNA-binding protein [Candidatus Doudnabacteria bacterium RIFCSPHIGHO2_02_FULL_49_24]OGE89759.1 MAG: DNA-binding protein [Candidatus Doudnabacteria bacterium RIFCSPHIGHO2_01_FULL_50_67]OGE90166.1 MAG: DNA-binding protein [Candidatus Doudnabacteria bacterium RIFCSPHIGHO2_12_FULL_48_16]OGE97824.1 MAG: DNA-binding protein [Candidatus Doudnabacteria bacterium RIFCSPLOWO2_01_FULL_49_40]OGF02761.1 MAG: DNA-binding protein [Candidatus Doudnabacteria bacterium RIFCSPLOWO2_12_FULL_49_8]OGF03310.